MVARTSVWDSTKRGAGRRASRRQIGHPHVARLLIAGIRQHVLRGVPRKTVHGVRQVVDLSHLLSRRHCRNVDEEIFPCYCDEVSIIRETDRPHIRFQMGKGVDTIEFLQVDQTDYRVRTPDCDVSSPRVNIDAINDTSMGIVAMELGQFGRVAFSGEGVGDHGAGARGYEEIVTRMGEGDLIDLIFLSLSGGGTFRKLDMIGEFFPIGSVEELETILRVPDGDDGGIRRPTQVEEGQFRVVFYGPDRLGSLSDVPEPQRAVFSRTCQSFRMSGIPS